MIRVEYANFAKDVRSWGTGNKYDQRVARLNEIESKIPFLSSSISLRKERIRLIKDLAIEREIMIFDRVLRSSFPDQKLCALEEKVSHLRILSNILKSDKSGTMSKNSIAKLPKDVRDLLFWAIWVEAGTPMEEQCGQKRFEKDPGVLIRKALPILHEKGRSICEQALAHYESLLAIERQKHTLVLLLEIGEKLALPFVDVKEVNERILKLPYEIQSSMYKSILSRYPTLKNDVIKAKEAVLKNPLLIGEKGSNIVFQHLEEQMALARTLEEAKKLEAYERLTLLCKSAKGCQVHAVMSSVSKEVREKFSEMEKETIRKTELRDDPRYLYQWRGAHPSGKGTRFEVYAPNARKVELVLTAFGHEEHVIDMKRNKYGAWEVFSEHAKPGRTYRYKIVDANGHTQYRTDPFGLSVQETNGVAESVVCDRGSHQWKDEKWMKKRSETKPLFQPLSIYEMSLDFWKKDHGRQLSFQEIAHQIVEYQKKVPFTHVELYALLDNKHDYSWGYQPDHFLTPNRRLGGMDGFKYLVDYLHQNDIGVILDWVPTHYKHSHGGDLSQSIHNFDGTNLFSAEESPWETVYFDYSKSETRRLMMASALYWIEEAHVDGLRVDAVSPLVQRNGQEQKHAIGFIKELNHHVHEKYPGILMIAEETDGFPNVTRPVSENGLGFDAKVGIHMQHKMRRYFRTPYEHRHHSEHHYTKLIENLKESGRHERWLIGHSHDDTASGNDTRHDTLYKSIPTDDSWRRFADMRVFHAWNLLTPGAGHMFHMGDEFGQKTAWNTRLNDNEGAVEWHLLDSKGQEGDSHRNLHSYVGDLHLLYRSKPAFWKHADWGYKHISDHPENRVVGFHRLDYEGSRLALFFNFSPMGYQKYDFPLPHVNDDPELKQVTGVHQIFNSDSLRYGGTGNFKTSSAEIIRNHVGEPTHFRFALPPLSLVVFEETLKKD